MALCCRPSLLIADEPTTALDVTTEAQILNLMRDLQEEFGMAIMYITHNLGVIAEMADNVAVMYMGKVVEQADVKTIFYNAAAPVYAGLLQSIPQLKDALTRHEHKRLETIKGMVPDPYTRLKGCPFHPRCPKFIEGVCDEIEPPCSSRNRVTWSAVIFTLSPPDRAMSTRNLSEIILCIVVRLSRTTITRKPFSGQCLSHQRGWFVMSDQAVTKEPLLEVIELKEILPHPARFL